MRLFTDIGVFKVDVAADPMVGLLGRRQLRPFEALLLEFPAEDFWGIHTMGLPYPIEIVWLDRNDMVVDKINLPADTPAVHPDLPALRVLEFNRGMATIAGIKVGEHLNLSTAN